MFSSLFIANRGEIARRINRTAQAMGIRTIVGYSEADADLPFVKEADEAVLLGAAPINESYRNADKVLQAALDAKAEAVHPGYGFLSENTDFARKVQAAGMLWVGPSADVIEKMGDKINARNIVARQGVPVSAGTPDPLDNVDEAVVAAEKIGYPVMIKASAGGGGMGMAVAHDAKEFKTEFDKIRGFAERMFGDPSVLIEKFFTSVRHVEIQILGLVDGRVLALGERDCSVQRRNQKLAEETPSPAIDGNTRRAMMQAAIDAGKAVGYRNAGTVGCLVDVTTGEFYFLEMNTRLQVEHPITEAVYGVDLVKEQLLIAAGRDISFDPVKVQPQGHAIEFRINAEDPKRFFPGPGHITEWEEPSGEGVRIDAGYAAGNTVTPNYDSLMAKLIVHAETRSEALLKMKTAVDEMVVAGPKSNLAFFAELLDNSEFVSGQYDTGIVARMRA